MTLKDKTTITFYNGLTTIGGPMIEVAYGHDHVLFDLGEVYRPELALPDENYRTLIQNQLIGDVANFYDPKITGVVLDTERWQHAGAYLSHLHLDHSKALNLIAPEIPVYAGPLTAKMLPILNAAGDFLLPAAGRQSSYTRPITAVEPGETVRVGQISLEVWSSDHDAYGATGLIVTTPDREVAYTGDIRLHGYHPDWVKQFLTRAQHSDVLITEATGYSWPEEAASKDDQEFQGPKSETELTAEVVELQKANPNRQITFNTYPTNVERLLQIMANSPRTVVLHAKRAQLLKQLGKDAYYYYLPREEKISELNPKLAIPYSQLLQDKHEYLWQVVDDFASLQPGGLYLHSNAEPLGDFDPSYAPFVQQFKELEIEFRALRCSGHADQKELAEIIELVQPPTLIPVHTLHPELVENPFGKRILPKRKQTITL